MNTKSLKYRDFCCSCFRNSDAKRSVDTYLDNGEKVSHIFLVVTGIDISKSDSADFTENMCLDCLVIVRKAFDFRQECLETQKKFARLREEEEEKAKLELLDIKEELEEPEVDELETVLEVKKVADTPKAPKCSLCNKSFTRKTTLNKHLQNVHKDYTEPDVDLSCEVCSIKFTKKSQFLDHNKEHRRSKSFICGLCEKVYETRGGWRKHQNLEHLKKKKKREKKPKKPPSNGHRPYLCSECGKSFAKRQNFQNHMTVHTGERNFPCTVCSKAFSRRGHLKQHMLIHTGERPHKCPECDSSFAQKSALVCHIRLHTGEKPYQCHLCLMRFRQYPTLKDHMSLHTGKLIECPDCGKTYSRRSFLRVHQRIHTGERPYACDRCPNRYRQKYHLDDHMGVHIGHRFHCDFCQKGYLHKWSLKKHMYNNHISEKPYTCSECGSGFVRRNRLMKHMQVSHGQKCVEITRQNQYILVQDTSEGKSRVTYKMVPVAKDS